MKKKLSRDWLFCLTDELEPDFTKWEDYVFEKVYVPHDWSTMYPICEGASSNGSGGYAKTGIGMYKRILRLHKIKGEETLLYFEGVYMNATVYLNQKKLFHHVYGYTPFEVNITKEMTDGDNELVVVADNSLQPGSRWYSGSGITRAVYLEKRKTTHIDRYGLYYTSEFFEKGKTLYAKISVFASVTEGAEYNATKLCLSLIDADGKTVAFREKKKAVGKSMSELTVKEPKAWSINSPYLYTLSAELFSGDERIDYAEVHVGIRSIEFSGKKGFFINQSPVKLNGVCLHHDGGCVGAAVHPKVWKRRLSKLKDMGCNAIRMSHNPPDPALLDLCDSMGFLVMDEAFDEWAYLKDKTLGSNTHESHGYSMYFKECHEEDLTAMILRDRNHPSIVLWSIGNEIPDQTAPDGPDTVRRLSKIVRDLDKTRKIVAACDQINAEPKAASDEFLDELEVVGYNYVGRWRERAETFYDEDHEKYPNRLIIGSENPSAGTARGDYSLEEVPWSFWNKNYFSAPVSTGKLLKYTMTHDFVLGDFMWTGVDYLGESNWPDKSTHCGCLDTAGFEKDAFFFYKSVWNTQKPFAYLCPHWNVEVNRDTILPVLCYTNCKEAELFVNGKSYGKKGKDFPAYGMTERWAHFDAPMSCVTTDDLFLCWDVAYEPGEIKVVGYKDKLPVTEYTVKTAGAPAIVQVSCDASELISDGEDIAQFEVRILDEFGRLVPNASVPITIEVEGVGEFVAADNGNSTDHTLANVPNRNTFAGLLYFIVRSTTVSGKVKIRVSSPGLRVAELVLETRK